MRTAEEIIGTIRENSEYKAKVISTGRYYLDVLEENGQKTAYLFSTPIFKENGGEAVNMEFEMNNGKILFEGSNSTVIKEGDQLIFKNNINGATVDLHEKNLAFDNGRLFTDDIEIVPTLNGVKVKEKIIVGRNPKINFKFNRIIYGIKDNSKSTAFMHKAFAPLITMSVIGIFDECGKIIAPGRLMYDKVSDLEYQVELYSHIHNGGMWFVYEINMHESKLFQDTTVESGHPYENNAFGCTAYIGKTEEFGEMWLYTKPDYNTLFKTAVQDIEEAYLYIPIYGNKQIGIKALCLKKRFCSFGSNWDNKVNDAKDSLSASIVGSYYRFDITKCLLTSHSEHKNLTFFDGLIVRANKNEMGFTTVATADSCYRPQILEIKHR